MSDQWRVAVSRYENYVSVYIPQSRDTWGDMSYLYYKNVFPAMFWDRLRKVDPETKLLRTIDKYQGICDRHNALIERAKELEEVGKRWTEPHTPTAIQGSFTAPPVAPTATSTTTGSKSG